MPFKKMSLWSFVFAVVVAGLLAWILSGRQEFGAFGPFVGDRGVGLMAAIAAAAIATLGFSMVPSRMFWLGLGSISLVLAIVDATGLQAWPDGFMVSFIVLTTAISAALIGNRFFGGAGEQGHAATPYRPHD